MSERIRVLLAEDNDDLRITLEMLMEDETDIDCVASTGVLQELGALAALHSPDVVVLDVQLDGGSSLPALGDLCAANPRTAFLVHSGYSDPVMKAAALKAGASGWVLKSGDTETLLAAIRAASSR